MNKIRLVTTWLALVSMALFLSGCSLLNTLVSAGITYGIYQATR
ncbi:MAG: hypothetical protein PVI33_06230 [Candidatus Omnitrophota bacterium]|jgi:hypothetical protein